MALRGRNGSRTSGRSGKRPSGLWHRNPAETSGQEILRDHEPGWILATEHGRTFRGRDVETGPQVKAWGRCFGIAPDRSRVRRSAQPSGGASIRSQGLGEKRHLSGWSRKPEPAGNGDVNALRGRIIAGAQGTSVRLPLGGRAGVPGKSQDDGSFGKSHRSGSWSGGNKRTPRGPNVKTRPQAKAWGRCFGTVPDPSRVRRKALLSGVADSRSQGDGERRHSSG